MKLKIRNILYLFVYLSILEAYYFLGLNFSMLYIGFLFLIYLFEVINRVMLRRIDFAMRFRELFYLLLPFCILLFANQHLAMLKINILIFQTTLGLSLFLIYKLLNESFAEKLDISKGFYLLFGKYFVYLIGFVSINLLFFTYNFSLFVYCLAISVFTLVMLTHYFYILDRITSLRLLATFLISLVLGIITYIIGGYFFDEYGFVNVIFFIVLLDVMDTTFQHYYINKIDESVIRLKLIFIFFLMVLSLQLINFSTFEQKINTGTEQNVLSGYVNKNP